MANYNTTASVVLTVNGKQAKQMLNQCEKEAEKLRKKIDAAAKAGDKASMKKFQRELNSVNKTMEQLRGSAATAEQTLRRIDKATPRELNRALKSLQQQLNGIQRGSAAWDAQMAKIRRVKDELRKINSEMATQQSMWSRMNKALNNTQTFIMGAVAALAGFVAAGRKAVNTYAEMEEQMANTQKYTRMTAQEVEELNVIFKNMDTRLAREQLNLLAQESGRLGYNTVQSVKEYVEAASIINVALVDLGEGATQTIAKLTNIFGVEEMYGVRDAMLKVGSTVNHLSQNCTAAKPYIVEFAQRMAGIGSTAKMTIPEIMAFAATLDANGQKVEMSATALQRTIMELFKDTAGMAKKVGLDAKEFAETLNKSTAEGVIKFLEALNAIGEDKALAVLSPLFQDLGLDGARVSSVLANLSSHLDFLKWQMGEAAEAFREGTSASNEYAIFNNTVQASIDKARKRVSELAIELGEKLYPIMRHIYTSSSVFLRVLNQLVSFIIENRKAIAGVITVLASYYITLGAVKASHLAYNVVVKAGTMVQNAWKTAVITGRLVVIAFTQGLGAATRAFKLLTATMSANPFGLIAAAVAGLILLIKSLADRTSEYTKKLREAVNTSKTFSSELGKEMHQLEELFGRLEAAKKGSKEYKEVKDTIISQYGKYLKGLVNEKNEIINLEAAYNRLAAAARIAAKERAINGAKQAAQDAFDNSFSDLAKSLQEALISSGKSYREAVRLTNRVVIDLQTSGTIGTDIVDELEAIKGNLAQKLNLPWGGKHPNNVVNEMIGVFSEYQTSMSEINNIERETNPLAEYGTDMLKKLIDDYEDKVKKGEGGRIIIGLGGPNPIVKDLSASELKDFLAEAKARLSVIESPSAEIVGGNPEFNLDDFTPYESEKDRKKREREEAAAAKRAATKAKKEFKDELNNTKGVWEADSANNLVDYTHGLKSYTEFLNEKHRLELKYFEDRAQVYEKWNLQEDEDYQELMKKKAEYEADWAKKNAAIKVNEAKRQQTAEETQTKMDYYTPDNAIYLNEEALNQKLFEIRIKYLKQMQSAYEQSSEEYFNYSVQIEEAEAAERLRLQKLFSEKIAEWKKRYEYQEAGTRLKLETQLLKQAYDNNLISYEQFIQAQEDLKKQYRVDYLPESAKTDSNNKDQQAIAMQREMEIIKSLYDQGVIDKKQYEEAKARIENSYRKKALDGVRQFGSAETNQLLDIYEAWKSFFDKTEDDGENWATKLARLAGSVFAVMASGMQMASEYMSACTDIEVAKLEKRYDREIELAEGNSYRIAYLEKKKEKEIAQTKNEASRKQFAMQIIQAVAQTATNALNAYGSALAVPAVGWLLAPIAASMAVAAGAMQIATLKKQQQASEAQGYAEGGFTPSGDKYKEVGVVHAGEWVASQELVNSPVARPVINALEYAQRNNRIGSLRMQDISGQNIVQMSSYGRSSARSVAPEVQISGQNDRSSAVMADLNTAILNLNNRLAEPLAAITTVAGDYGINKAQADYAMLLKNKSPKFK